MAVFLVTIERVFTATYRKSPLVQIKTFPTLIHLAGRSLAKIDPDALWKSEIVDGGICN